MAEQVMYHNGNYHNTSARGGITTPVAPEGGTPAYPGNQPGIPVPPIAPEGGFPTYPGNDNIPETPIAPEGGFPSYPGNDNIPETPIAPEGGFPTYPGNDNIPSLPIAPEGGFPVYPGDNMPSLPIAPEGGFPAYPGDNVPSLPIAPEGGFPAYPGPSWPGALPPVQYYTQVRFLNASTNAFPVNISIDGNLYAANSRFGSITSYAWISDGFHTVTVRRATGLRTILYQQTFPFISGEKVTMVLVDSGSGLSMSRVSDMGCMNLPYNSGCYRIANMTYSGSSYDLMLYGGETVFRNVKFGSAAPYKQTIAGSYQFYLTNSSNLTVIREIPVIVIGAFAPSSLANEPLVSFQVDIEPGRSYTSYVIGNNWSDYSLRVLTVVD